MNDREEAICARLRTVRELFKWSQKDFAGELGITRDRLASIEYARTPVRGELAKKLARRFKISFRWLVEGKPPIRLYVPLHAQLEALLSDEVLLSAIYDEQLKRALDVQIAGLQLVFGNRLSDERLIGLYLEHQPMAGAPNHEQLAFLLNDLITTRLADMPEPLEQWFFDAVVDAVDRFYQQHKEQLKHPKSSSAMVKK